MIRQPYPLVIHIGFLVFFLAAVLSLSFQEIRNASAQWVNGPKIYLRNIGVIALGVGLLIFASREVLHGVDPSGVRHLW